MEDADLPEFHPNALHFSAAEARACDQSDFKLTSLLRNEVASNNSMTGFNIASALSAFSIPLCMNTAHNCHDLRLKSGIQTCPQINLCFISKKSISI